MHQCRLTYLLLAAFMAIALNCGGGGNGTAAPPPPPPGPVINSFTTDRAEATVGEAVTLTAAFQNGEGTIDPQPGPVQNLVPVPMHPQTDTTYTLTVRNSAGVSVSRSLSVHILPVPQTPVISAPIFVSPNAAGFTASVPNQTECTFVWRVENGTLTAGAGTNKVRFTSGGVGTLKLFCTVTNRAGASAAGQEEIPVAFPTLPAARLGGIFCQDQVFVGMRGVLASYTNAPGRLFSWSLAGGSATSPTGTPTLTFDVGGTPGTCVLTATAQDPGLAPVQRSREVKVVEDAFLKRVGEMIPRMDFISQKLPNGRILVAGGLPLNGATSDLPPLATAEVYDPATRTWAFTGSMNQGRRGHVSVSLPDGRVMVIGGGSDAYFYSASYSPISTCEVYDPSTGVWSPAAPMAHARFHPTATLLRNGTVLVVGGEDYWNADAECYDPATDRWTVVASLQFGRQHHSATLLADGRVLVAGGTYQGLQTASCELYDPATDTWSLSAQLARARLTHVAALLPNGRVLVAGGQTSESSYSTMDSCECFDPVTGTWSPTGSLLANDPYPRLAGLADGSVVMMGERVLERYDPARGEWTLIGHLSDDRSMGSLAVLGDGNLMAMGGAGMASAAEFCDPATGILQRAGSMRANRWNSPAFPLGNGKILLTGGSGALPDGTSLDCELYDPTADAWEPTGAMAQRRLDFSGVVLPDGTVLAAGGFGPYSFSSAGPLISAERFDPATGSWRDAGEMTIWREGGQGVLLHDGRMMVAGNEVVPYGVIVPGWTDNSPSFGDIYNPTQNSWSATKAMAHRRSSHQTVLLPNGKVLVIGGRASNNGVAYEQSSAEIYDPVVDGWSPTGSMAQARCAFTATVLANGKVLVVGGATFSIPTWTVFATAELYDPATGLWTPTGAMAQARNSHTAILLPDGRVLVAGGWTFSNNFWSDPFDSAEIYDPTTGRWSPAGSMPVPMLAPALTPLGNGTWLLPGGGTLTNFFKPKG